MSSSAPHEVLLELTEASAAGEELTLDPAFAAAFGRVLADESLDGSMKALALLLPAEQQLSQEMSVVDVDAIHITEAADVPWISFSLLFHFLGFVFSGPKGFISLFVFFGSFEFVLFFGIMIVRWWLSGWVSGHLT